MGSLNLGTGPLNLGILKRMDAAITNDYRECNNISRTLYCVFYLKTPVEIFIGFG